MSKMETCPLCGLFSTLVKESHYQNVHNISKHQITKYLGLAEPYQEQNKKAGEVQKIFYDNHEKLKQDLYKANLPDTIDLVMLDSLIQHVSDRKFQKQAKESPELATKIINATLFLPIDADILERCYCLLNPEKRARVCEKNNQPKFNTYNLGYYQYCGTVQQCFCARKKQIAGASKEKND